MPVPHALLVHGGAGDLPEGEGGFDETGVGVVMRLRYEDREPLDRMASCTARRVTNPAISSSSLFVFRGRYDRGAQTIA